MLQVLTEKMKLSYTSGLFLISGFLFMGLAVLAHRLGLDPNAGWGKGRTYLMAVGAVVTVGGLVHHFYAEKIKDHIRLRLQTIPELHKVEERLAFSAAAIAVLMVYVWFVSVGTWVFWPTYSDYYDQLAASFLKGQTYLDIEPDPQLLALPDPYDPEAREGIPFPGDMSLYKGKFYLYWGAAPALILAAIKLIIPIRVYDQYFVFLFSSGAFGFQALLLLSIWRRFFQGSPVWLLACGTVVAGLVGPYTWMLNEPTIYEAATLGGQFFFVGGLFFAYHAMENNLDHYKLAATGILWACALGTRIVQAGPVVVLVLISINRFFNTHSQNQPKSKRAFKLLTLTLPLLLGVSAMAYYNIIRFGSIFEFGIYYQVGGTNMVEFYDVLFSPVYAFQNFSNYMLNPFKLSMEFPFASPVFGNMETSALVRNLPEIYRAEKIAGLIFSSPVLLLFLIPITWLITSKTKSVHNDQSNNHTYLRLPEWLITGLICAFLAGFFPLLIYFWVATRYVPDFIAPVSILAVAGLWQIYSWSGQNSTKQSITGVALALISGYSVVLNTLLAFSSHVGRFSTYNPALLESLKKLFDR